MADKKPTLIDYGLKFLRDLISEKPAAPGQPAVPGKKVSLDDIPLDDLKREKVRLEQEERKMLAELREIEGEKKKLFADGVRNASEREQRVLARRIKELDLRAQNMDHMLQSISKQMRIINGLVQIKERARLSKESGVASWTAIDLGELIQYVNQATVDGEFQMNKFDELNRTLEQADAISPQYSEDQDVLDIVAQMQSAREVADNPVEVDRRFEELSRKMESKNTEANEEEL